MKITAAVITVVTAFASIASAKQSSPSDTYDYVIVGGGVAGIYVYTH